MDRKKKIWSITWVAMAIEVVAAILYPYAYSVWNILLFALCWVGFSMAAILLAWAFFVAKERKRALLFGALCAAATIGASFGVSTAVSVLCDDVEPRVPFIIATFLLFVHTVVFFALICNRAGGKKVAKPILGSVLICCVLAADVVGAVVPNALFRNSGTYIAAIRAARMKEYTVIPEEAFKRTTPDYDRDVKLLVNIDETTQVPDYVEYLSSQEEITEEALAYYIKPYIGTQVTDILFSICGQTSVTQSEYLTWCGDKVKWTVENGKEVDYSHIPWWWYILQEKDIDPVPYWIKACNENNIRPWLSFRMNDCHDSGEETSPLRGELFYVAKENGWMIGEEYGYYHTCYDYSVPQIRSIMIAYIEEQLLRYDVYGIELDWLREIYCFDYLHEDNATIVGIMNDFMRGVNVVVKEAEEKWGHDIKINARLMRDVDQNKIFGFDVRTWAKEKLVDSVTVTPRFSSCDSDMNIRYWRDEFPTLEIYAGIETRVTNDGSVKENVVAGAEVARGYAAEYLGEDADGMYLFNYMAYSYLKRNDAIYNTCGSIRTVYSSTRRHVMTYQDIAPEGSSRYQPLPTAALKNKPAILVQKTGYIPENASVNIYIGVANKFKPSDVNVTVSGSYACAYEGRATIYGENEVGGGDDIPDGYLPEGSKAYRFSVTDVSKLGNAVYVTIENDSIIPLIVTYLEIEIIP